MSGLFPLATSITALAVMFAILLRLNVTIALLSLTVVPFMYLCLRYYTSTLVNREERVKELESKLLSRLYETFGAIRLVKSFSRETHELRRYTDAGETTMNARIAITWQSSMFSVVVSTITILGTAVVVIVGGTQVMSGRLSLGELTGDIRVEDVGFTYPDGTRVLHDITFTARPGEMIALVGLTGAGKTTLVSLIPRFYDTTEGRVVIDGVDVRRYKVRSLREKIAIVLQDPVLFQGTITENLRYGRLDATAEEIEQAARAAHAHEFISHLAKGYDTEIAEAGGSLSGGERQRLSGARAILQKPPILIPAQ